MCPHENYFYLKTCSLILNLDFVLEVSFGKFFSRVSFRTDMGSGGVGAAAQLEVIPGVQDPTILHMSINPL